MKKITAIITAILLICAVIVPVMMSANAESTPLTNLYNEDYYTVIQMLQVRIRLILIKQIK